MKTGDLVQQVFFHGFIFEMVDGKPSVIPMREGAFLPPELEAELKAQREAVVALVFCPVCDRVMTRKCDRIAVATNPVLCDRGGAKAYQDANGKKHEASERCPYKSTR